MAALTNSFVPTSAHIVGGQFNVTPPVLTDGQCSVFELDASGNLKVNVVAGGGSGSNAAAGPTGSAVPADADYQGVNIGGILTGVTGLALGATTKAPTVAIVDGSGNQITSFGGGTQYADGTTQATPTGTVALGKNPSNILHSLALDASGNLDVVVNAPLPAGTNVIGHVIVDSGSITVSGSVSVSNFPATQNVAGTTADGTTTETNFLVVGGESNDATAQYQPIPLGATGRSVIIEGFAGGTAVPVSGTVSVTNFANPLPVSQSGNWTVRVVGNTGAVLDAAGDNVAAPANELIVGGIFNNNTGTTAAITAGNVARLQLDSHGLMLVDIASVNGAALSKTNPLFSNISDGTNSLTAALSAWGTPPTGTEVMGVNANVVVALPAGTNIIGKVDILGNAGATLDSTIGAATAPTNALATSAVYQTTVPSLTAGQAVAAQCDVTGSRYVNIAGRVPTYSAVANSTTTPTFTAAAGDIAVLPGSASKTIRVTRVEVTLSTTGTAAIETVSLVKRSTADTGGTSSAMTIVPHDSRFGAASAAPLLYTAAPTLGTAVGFMRATQFNDQSASLPGAATWIWTFGDGRGGATGVVLNGVAQELCINLGGVVATQTAAVSFEWTEDNS